MWSAVSAPARDRRGPGVRRLRRRNSVGNWHALFYPLKHGSEEKVKDLFRRSGRPSFEVTDGDGKVVGKLLGTMAFVGREMAVRVIEVEGPLPVVAAHMSRQQAVKDFERELEELISV